MFKSKAVLDYWLSMQAKIHEDEMLKESHALTAEMRYHLNERFLTFDALWRDVLLTDLEKLLDGLAAELKGRTNKEKIDAMRVNQSLRYFNAEVRKISPPSRLISPANPYLMALAELESQVAQAEEEANWHDGSLYELRVQKLGTPIQWSTEGVLYRSQALMNIRGHSLWEGEDAVQVERREPMGVFSSILGTAFQMMYEVQDDDDYYFEASDWLKLMGLYRTFHDTITALPAAVLGTTKEASHA